MRTKLVAWSLGIASLILALAGPGVGSSSAREAEVESIARRLVAGIGKGDWTDWERDASDDLLYTTECGRTLTKGDLRGIFRPPLPGQSRGLAMSVVAFRSQGDGAVLVYEIQEAPGGERYRVTDTYWRQGGRWRLVAASVTDRADWEADASTGADR